MGIVVFMVKDSWQHTVMNNCALSGVTNKIFLAPLSCV